MDYSLDPLSYAMSLSFPFPGPPATTQAPDPNPPLGIPDLSELDLESLLFPDNPFPSSPTIEILSASSSKNKPRLLVDGHVYNFKRQYKNGRLLHRCSQRTPPCLATITSDKKKVCILTTAGEHNHPKPSSEKLRRLSTRWLAVQRHQRNPFTSLQRSQGWKRLMLSNNSTTDTARIHTQVSNLQMSDMNYFINSVIQSKINDSNENSHFSMNYL